jgi:uncharacterized protein YjiS (DUF1127 family)
MSSKLDLEIDASERPDVLTSPVELRRPLDSPHVLRDHASAALLSAGFRSLARGLRAALAVPRRSRRRRATAAALMRCSDRVLADIGIRREDIPLIARGLDPKRAASQTVPAGPVAGAARPARAAGHDQRGMSHGWPRRHPPALAEQA